MATLKSYNQGSNLSQQQMQHQQLDMSLGVPVDQSYYFNSFYDNNNNNNVNTNSLMGSNNIDTPPNKKMKLNDEYESKPSLMKILNQNDNNQTIAQDNSNKEQFSILKPLRDFQLLNQNGLMNDNSPIVNNQIYNNFHHQTGNFHHHNYHHHQNRHDYYMEQSLVKALEAPSLINTPTSSISSSQPAYSDYMFKYEKSEDTAHQHHHHHMNSNTHHSLTDDDEEEEDFEDDFEDETNSNSHNNSQYDYNDENNNNNTYNLSDRQNCEINTYGTSVFDSPLSLSTLNEDPHLTTLTTRQQQDRFQKMQPNLSNNHNVHLSKTSPIPQIPVNTQQQQQQQSPAITSLLNIKNENSDSNNLHKSNNSMTCSTVVTKLPENIPTDTQSLKKSVHHFNNCTLNDYELISLPLRELNKRLRYVPKMTAIDLKKRRRTLKNRKYAQNCRSKRLEQKCEMELQNIKLKSDIQRLNKLIDKFQREKQMYKAYIDDLLKDPSKISNKPNMFLLNDNNNNIESIEQPQLNNQQSCSSSINLTDSIDQRPYLIN